MSRVPEAAGADQEWRIRTYRPGDEGAIVELFNRVFGRRISVAHWRWKLGHHGAVATNVWLAVDREDRPVFHYAGIPCRFRFPDGGEGRVMVAVDAFTDPLYRRRGIFTAVMRAAHDQWRREGFPLVLGLPNEQWGSRTQALNWEPLFGLRWLIRPLRPEALVARRLGLPFLSRLRPVGALWNGLWRRPRDRGVTLRAIEHAAEEAAAAWEACRPPEVATLERGAAWMAWRFLDSPQQRYRALLACRDGRPVGYAAYRVDESHGRRFGFLAEILAPEGDSEAWHALVDGTLSRLHAAGADAVATLAVPGSSGYRRLRRRGFLWSWGEFLFHVVFLDPGADVEPLRSSRGWMLTGSEFDVI